jgi:hypothetical protein
MDRPGGGPSSKKKEKQNKNLYVNCIRRRTEPQTKCCVVLLTLFVCTVCCVKGFDNSRPFGPSSRHFWRMYVYMCISTSPSASQRPRNILFFSRNSYSIPIRKGKKTSCDWLWFQCHSLDVLDVKLFLIGTHLMNWWWWVDRRREGLYIQQLIGLLFSDTKWSGWMELFVSSLTKWFLLYLGYICLAL